MKTAKSILCILLVLATTSFAMAADETNGPVPSEAQGSWTLVVYKDPNCGCCDKWAEHMKTHGFSVESVLESDLSVRKRALGVPDGLWACHTAVVDGYVIEGHVPAADVERLLEDRPEAKGLAVPGMPVGSPGMEYGGRRQAFDVLLFDATGNTTVFKHHPASG